MLLPHAFYPYVINGLLVYFHTKYFKQLLSPLLLAQPIINVVFDFWEIQQSKQSSVPGMLRVLTPSIVTFYKVS